MENPKEMEKMIKGWFYYHNEARSNYTPGWARAGVIGLLLLMIIFQTIGFASHQFQSPLWYLEDICFGILGIATLTPKLSTTRKKYGVEGWMQKAIIFSLLVLFWTVGKILIIYSGFL